MVVDEAVGATTRITITTAAEEALIIRISGRRHSGRIERACSPTTYRLTKALGLLARRDRVEDTTSMSKDPHVSRILWSKTCKPLKILKFKASSSAAVLQKYVVEVAAPSCRSLSSDSAPTASTRCVSHVNSSAESVACTFAAIVNYSVKAVSHSCAITDAHATAKEPIASD